MRLVVAAPGSCYGAAVSNHHQNRNKGSLFDNAEKRKPSHPDLRGECAIDGEAYDMQAWRRDDQLALSLAPARNGSGAYPPDAFRGSLDEPTGRPRSEDGKGAAPAWVGDVVGDEASFAVKAFAKQGKSGPYLTLFFERIEA